MPTKSTPKKRRPRNSIVVQRTLPAAPPAAQLRRYALAAVQPGSAVTLRVVGAAEAKRLNAGYRGKERATNVLSFCYDRRHGDVVLCHPVIRREAKAQHKRLAAHYAHLVVHGVLHLRGHDHVRRRDAVRMERAEIRILRRLGFANPYE
jgi:probable rRNA maturation factor